MKGIFKTIVFSIIFLSSFVSVNAKVSFQIHSQQDSTETIESARVTKKNVVIADSILLGSTYFFHYVPFESKILRTYHPSFEPTGKQLFDKLLRFNNGFYAYRSGLGQPHRQLFFTPNTSTKFRFQENSLSGYLFTPENARFFQVAKPYTELLFGNTFESDYQLNAIHSQNILPNWNAGVDYNLISTDGLYVNSATLNHSLSATTHFFTKNQRYNVLAGLVWNNYYIGEFGGITADSLLAMQSNRKAIPVAQTLATNRYIDLHGFAQQSFRLARTDSNASRSTFNLGKISHEILYSKERRRYLDSSDAVYENYYFDTLKTDDRIITEKLSNSLFWSNDIYQDAVYRNPFKIYAGIYHELIHTRDMMSFDKFNQLTFLGRARISPIRYITITPYIEQVFTSDYSNGDYKYMGTADFDFSDTKFPLQTSFELELSARKPDYIFWKYGSNHYQWDESPSERTNTFRASGSATYQSFNLGVSYYSINDLYYFNEDISPVIYGDNISIFQASLNFNVDFFNLVHWKSNSAFQKASVNEIISIPTLYTKNSIFFDFWMFKKGLHIQTGFDIYYNTKYHAKAYSPDLATFYVQNIKEYGDNLWADVFVNIHIKRAIIYIKYAHFNAKLGGKAYYMIPGYPVPDAVFKWGFIWKFFD